jgi:hypothetical protein
MKINSYILILLTITFILISNSCRTVKYTDAYSDFYEPVKTENGLISVDAIPESLISSLPLNFQLAYYSGHLSCYSDYNGCLKIFNLNPLFQKAKKSKEFKKLLKLAHSDNTILVFTPIAYPNVFCVIPNEDIDTLLEETYFPSWLDYLEQWQTNEEINNQLNKSLQELLVSNYENEKINNFLENNLVEFDKKIKETNENINRIKLEINTQRKKLGINEELQLDNLNSTDEKFNTRPPFNLRIRYSIETDPFIEVLKKYTKDVSDKPWATNEMKGGKYIDSELADKIQAINDKFNNPDLITDIKLRNEVKNLKSKGFNGIQVTSGGRTPLRQGHLYSESKSNKNPVAKYVGSQHLFAQSADMKLSEDFKNWDSDNHKSLRGTLSKMGLAMRVEDDPVHFELKNPSEGSKSQKLAMIRAYSKKAKSIKAAQGAVKENLVFESDKLTKQKDQLDKDIEAKKKEIENKSSIFTKISAKYNELQHELGSLNADIARKEAEARRTEAQSRRDRERREYFNRPRPSDPSKDPIDRPFEVQPKQNKPEREPTIKKIKFDVALIKFKINNSILS